MMNMVLELAGLTKSKAGIQGPMVKTEEHPTGLQKAGSGTSSLNVEGFIWIFYTAKLLK